eukprot:9262092-Pyramimonas_sp.AAC.1
MDPEDPFKPLNKQQEVDKLQKTWSRWWKLGEKHRILHWPGDLEERPPRPSLDYMRGVLRSFKTMSGMGFCTIRPRQLRELCDSAVDCLIDLIMAVEATAGWPMQVTKIAFLAKRLGGVRPI